MMPLVEQSNGLGHGQNSVEKGPVFSSVIGIFWGTPNQ
jgi:hypothetical protein